jgi:hypothetical protein
MLTLKTGLRFGFKNKNYNDWVGVEGTIMRVSIDPKYVVQVAVAEIISGEENTVKLAIDQPYQFIKDVYETVFGVYN